MGAAPVHSSNTLLEARYRELVNYSDVVVLKNLNSPESVQLADYFVALRGVPVQNVCEVTTSIAEEIDRATFASLRSQVEACMSSRGLVNSTNYLVTTKGFPLKVQDPVAWAFASVDSELALINGPYAGSIGGVWWLNSPYFNNRGPFSRASFGFYIVARITGYTVEEAKDLLDQATAGIGRKGRFVFDVDPTKGGGYVIGNTWMQDAATVLTAKGFDVLLDETTTFVTGESKVAGYTSWGSNDATWYATYDSNAGFENDADADGVPDAWTADEEPGVGNVTRNGTSPDAGAWAVGVVRSVAVPGASGIHQDIPPLPETRYFAGGRALLSGVSSEGGAHLQLTAVDGFDQALATFNGSKRTGSSGGWVDLGQAIYEPTAGAAALRIAAVLTDSSGTVQFDNVRLYAIRPHMDWVPGALAETYVSTGGRSFTYGTGYGQSLVADLVRDGVSGTKGYVYEPFLDAVAHPDILFDVLTDGYTLGESYAQASELALSWQDVVLGDPKFAPYNMAYLPDLAAFGVFPSSSTVVSGALVNVSGTVTNLGAYPAENATVTLYLGDPAAGGQPLDSMIVSVAHGGSVPVAFAWDSEGEVGTADLCVFADATDDYYEGDEANNVGCVSVAVDPPLTFPLAEGWNFVSLPVVPSRTEIAWVLRSIDGLYDRVVRYDGSDAADPWKAYASSGGGDSFALDHTVSFWVRVTAPGGATLLSGGTRPSLTAIPLGAGWNMVGFPAGAGRTVALALAGVPWTRLATFDPAGDPYRTRALAASDALTPGVGVWVFVTSPVVWTVAY